MDALLILGGLLMMFSGWLWMVMQAFTKSLFWGMGSLFPPLTMAFMLGHWRNASKPFTLMTLGLIPLIVGLALLGSHDSERFDAILNLSWFKPVPRQAPESNIHLRGELNGEPFLPSQGEFVDGVLVLREGADFFAQREVRIRLPEGNPGPLRVAVMPHDREQIPQIEISWRLPDQDLPEAHLITKGYTLYLDLHPQPPHLMVGDFHLVLPSRYGTSLSGKVELLTDHFGLSRNRRTGS